MLVPPRLDDRTFPDLVAELLARIPAHTPEYTNPVPGDPGHTLIELFAYLGDTLLYRVNLIPERQRMEFLRIVGVPMRGAQPSTGLIALSYGGLDKPTATPTADNLRPWCVASGGNVQFETRRPMTLLPVKAKAYYKRGLDEIERTAVEPLLGDLGKLYELGANKPRPYVTTEAFPNGANPKGLDLAAASLDTTLWIGLFAGHKALKAQTLEKLGRDTGGAQRVLSVGVVPVTDGPSNFVERLTAGAGTKRPIPVVWEIATGRAVRGRPEFHALEVLRDSTKGLTRTGVVELLLPDDDDIGLPDNDVRTNIDAGVGPRPPRIDDDTQNDRLVTWLRLRPTKSVDRLALAWVGVNAVEVDQRRTITNAIIGTSAGAPDQRFATPGATVERDSFVLQVEEEGRGFVTWAMVEHVALAGRDDRVYALDDQEGVVAFGDGVRGRIPEAGARIRVATMRAGGGPQGNLPPGSIKTITAVRLDDGAKVDLVEVEQPIPTQGGIAAESLEEAERRIPDVLRHRERAVTEEDVVAVAASTPGVRLGRVEVLKGFKPHQRRQDVPGVVSVMVLPRLDGFMPPNPRPARHTVEAVHEWLSERVPLATEVYVIGVEYVPIGVSVGFELRDGANREETILAVRMAVRRLLWPLPPGGPFEDASGWPRGRPVRERELEVAVARVPGVDEVKGIKLFQKKKDGDEYRVVKPGRDGSAQIQLTRWQLPEVLKLAVVADDPLESLEGIEDPASEGAVPVPVVPEVC